ncbi:MAG: PAS domain S-box protein [Myxococcota bacterium]|nr:PAS domain S-box protein [Myxococcota bacterium]
MNDTTEESLIAEMGTDTSSEPVYLVQDGESVAISPQQLLENFENGTYSGDTEVRIHPTAPPLPLRRYIREMVWMTYSAHRAPHAEVTELPKFEAAFSSAPIGIVLSDLAGRIQMVNEQFAQLLGYTKEELVGFRVGEVSFSEDRDHEVVLGNRVLSGELPAYQMEKRFIRKDRTVVATLMSVSLSRTEAGTPEYVIAHVVDLTDLKRLERTIAENERLSVVGEFATGVAHDVNNLLQVITASVLEIDSAESETNKAAIAAVMDAVSRGARWTAQLRDYRRERRDNTRRIEVDTFLSHLRPVLQRSVGRSVALELDLAAPLAEVVIASETLERLLLNLTSNASRAMDGAGRLQIRTKFQESTHTLQLEVQDTGIGMTSEVLSRCLDDNFTTYESQGGTGFGLSFVRRVVRQSGGTLEIESVLGKGTTVRIAWTC